MLSVGTEDESGLTNEELNEFVNYVGLSEANNKFFYKDYIFNAISFIEKNVAK